MLGAFTASPSFGKMTPNVAQCCDDGTKANICLLSKAHQLRTGEWLTQSNTDCLHGYPGSASTVAEMSLEHP